MNADKKNIVVGMIDPAMANSFKTFIQKKEGYLVPEVVVSEEDLLKYLEETEEEIYGLILTSDLAKKINDLRLDYLSNVLVTLREKYPHIRIAILSSERVGHPFLAELVNMGIYNIFLRQDNNLSVQLILDVLDNGKSFGEVSLFRKVDTGIPWRKMDSGPSTIKIETSNKRNSEPEKKQENERKDKQVIKREFNINFQQTETKVIGVTVQPKLILVGGAANRVGSSFFAHYLSFILAEREVSISYLENPYQYGYTYDRYWGEGLSENYVSPFCDVYLQKDNSNDWIYKNVFMNVLNPLIENPYKKLDLETFLKVLLSQRTPIKVVDVGVDWNNDNFLELSQMADYIFFVTEPDPFLNQVLIEKRPYPSLLKENGEWIDNLQIVMNKATYKIANHSIFNDVFDDIWIVPELNREEIFKCESERVPITNSKRLVEDLESLTNELIEMILPPEFLKKKTKTKWKFPKITVTR
ncbi:hypothetical protein [Cytobacillus firmus]|uniref:hypothetical protein n=1 Tax=Cytobacillus firmus TaxID=1399 RepID=UPI0018CE117E|nr:hypothetical protein [Cytobacillus firmus]MBG9587676.1 hypothetical protein [Cytobacillus firmus]